MGKSLQLKEKKPTFKQQRKQLKEDLEKLDTMTLQEKQALYKKYPWLDDWLLQRIHLNDALNKIKWSPNMDAACDIKGSNKHFENYCSIKDCALKRDLTPYRVYCNVPYLLSKEFINKFEETKQQEKDFKAVIIIPLRSSN